MSVIQVFIKQESFLIQWDHELEIEDGQVIDPGTGIKKIIHRIRIPLDEAASIKDYLNDCLDSAIVRYKSNRLMVLKDEVEILEKELKEIYSRRETERRKKEMDDKYIKPEEMDDETDGE